ncbi:hypothetical protein [Actinoplanes sp. NPDC026619]|uniref:hypothetical protein n=1 Tax=Actinoplanes sp. NPDC026619 TaxID=3155798 RepID=UPI0033E3AE2F
MKRGVRTSVLVLGATALLAAGGAVTAWANWTTGSNAQVTVGGATLPAMAAPQATLAGTHPRISWSAPTTNVPITGYAVVRTSNAGAVVACTVAVTTSSCTDNAAVGGTTVRYRVRATLGAGWAGPDSPQSGEVTVPAVATLPARTAAQGPAPAVATTAPTVKADGTAAAVAPKPPLAETSTGAAATTTTAPAAEKPTEATTTAPAVAPTTTAPADELPLTATATAGS